MKKLIAIALLIAMCLSLFAGCGEEEPAATQPTAGNMANAKEYLTSMYQTGKKGEPIELTADQDVLKSIVIETVSYKVDWTVAITEGPADSVKVGESKKENHVMLDIPLHSGEDILFTATATITDPDGNTDTVTFDYKVVGQQLSGDGKTMEELVEAAYALEENTSMDGLAVLTGKVTMINTPYDEGYKNITVTIQIGELSDKQIKCYRLSGDGAENIGMNDTITVSGTLKNYNGNVQFDAGCKLDELIKSTDPLPVAPEDPKQIVAEAYALDKGASLAYEATLTGIINTIDSPFDPGFGNVTVTMVVEGCETQPIKCYRMKGEGADQLEPGDRITVTGYISNYNGTIEFVQGCNLDAFEKGVGEVITAPEDPKQIVAEAYALADGALLPYQATLTGKIISVDSPYDAGYGNITVTIAVEGCEDKPIKCYRMKGTGVETIALNDTITVTGIIKNYGGTIEFDTGCQLTNVNKVPGENETTTPETVVPETDPAKIMAAAENLAADQELGYTVTLSGNITAVDTAYDANYKNITVTIAVTGTRSFLKCYRLKGDNADKLGIGDTITITGSIKNYQGVIELINGTVTSWTDGVYEGPAEPDIQGETDPAKIVDAAYSLENNQELSFQNTLTGKVTAIKDAYSAEWENVSVAIVVAGRETKPIVCYRMKGTGADQVKEGDTITVTGNLKNYNGSVQLVNGNMTSLVPGVPQTTVVETDAAKILNDAYALNSGDFLPYQATLTGKVISVDEVYSEQYKNVTVTIEVSGYADKPVKCYRMVGAGVEEVDIGYVITVTGDITKYFETVEFTNSTNQGRKCELTAIVERGEKAPTDPKQIVDAAFALEKGASLPYTASLTGKIVDIPTAYSDQYKNVTVVIEVEGSNGMKQIECYRLKGEGADALAVGDTITVTGVLTRYYKKATDEKPELDKIEFTQGCSLG